MPHVFRYYRRRMGRRVALATLTLTAALALTSSIVVAQQQQNVEKPR